MAAVSAFRSNGLVADAYGRGICPGITQASRAADGTLLDSKGGGLSGGARVSRSNGLVIFVLTFLHRLAWSVVPTALILAAEKGRDFATSSAVCRLSAVN